MGARFRFSNHTGTQTKEMAGCSVNGHTRYMKRVDQRLFQAQETSHNTSKHTQSFAIHTNVAVAFYQQGKGTGIVKRHPNVLHDRAGHAYTS